MPNFKLDISFDGTNYFGWQIQKNKRTVQGDITDAFRKVIKNEKYNLIGSGRTDSGVHANHQIANIFLDTNLNASEIKNAINANTNKDIHINSCTEVDEEFNSRFSAIKREYFYRIVTKYNPIYRNYKWFLNHDIDISKLNSCSKLILGDNDFSAFCKATSLKENNYCIIYKSKWILKENQLIYTIKANRFLHHMVRFLVGTMIEVSKGKVKFVDFKNLFSNKKFNNIIVKAPAHGLYLNKVYYE